jgi:hypothetical protein
MPERRIPKAERSVCEVPTERLDAIRHQLAIVRALADEIERCLPEGADTTHERLVEELARLGCRCVETGVAMAKQVGP